MTKERKIAIKIWEEIKAFILSSPQDVTSRSFIAMKHSITRKHGMYWNCNCWFCHYVRKTVRNDEGFIVDEGCDRCPLHKLVRAAPGDCGCDIGLAQAPYARLANDWTDNAIKAEACDMIIKALKGEE